MAMGLLVAGVGQQPAPSVWRRGCDRQPISWGLLCHVFRKINIVTFVSQYTIGVTVVKYLE
jgi:hypothetical protein